MAYVTLFCFCFYIYVSFLEWVLHRYFMHGIGTFSSVLKNWWNGLHIKHHLATPLNQELRGQQDADGLAFLLKSEIMLMLLSFAGSALFWQLCGLHELFGVYVLAVGTAVFSLVYFWVWGSFHPSYHHQYVSINKPNTVEGRTITIHGLFPHQNTHHICACKGGVWCALFRWLKTYHTLHHLNKGDKANFNVLLPGADFIFNTYKGCVDNTEYFRKHEPKTDQEKWLSNHPRFKVKVCTDNTVMYEDEEGVWRRLPHDI